MGQESHVTSYSNLEHSKNAEKVKESGKGLYTDFSHANSRLSLTSLRETENYLRNDSETIK